MSNNKWSYRILIAILLIPLFFISVKNSHDWGDDFAQYLIQARNIVDGRPQTENGLVLNEKEHAFAIQAYPVGFPLIISPIYFFFKQNILPFCFLITIILVITGQLIYEYFNSRTGSLTAIIITLLFCYNLYILDLKKKIQSEIPFTLLLIIILLWMESSYYKKSKSWIVTGFLFAFLISIRLAGIPLLVAFLLFELNNLRKCTDLQTRKNIYKKTILSIASAFMIFFLLNEIIFPIHVGSLFSFYTGAFQNHDFQILSNLAFYFKVSGFIFPFFGLSISPVWILFSLTGWLIRLIKSPTICEYFFPLYALLIICYPYADAGVRFLIPVLPVLIYYFWYFLYSIFSLTGKKVNYICAFIIIIPLISYASPIHGIIASQNEIEDGPQKPEAVELFNYIKSIPSSSAIVFCRARAMSFYSDHPVLYPPKRQNPEDSFSEFHNFKSLYLVIAKVNDDNEIYDAKLNQFIGKYNDSYEHIWENSHFNVYRQK